MPSVESANDSAECGADLIAVDFCSGSVQDSLIGVKKAFATGELAPQLAAMAFNATCAAEVVLVITDDGKPTDIMSNHNVAKMLSRMTKRRRCAAEHRPAIDATTRDACVAH